MAEPTEIGPGNARTSSVHVDMSKGWMESHPELAGKALLEFFQDHPPERWKLTIGKAHMPGMYLTLHAIRRD